jgi:hypothetical protein
MWMVLLVLLEVLTFVEAFVTKELSVLMIPINCAVNELSNYFFIKILCRDISVGIIGGSSLVAGEILPSPLPEYCLFCVKVR